MSMILARFLFYIRVDLYLPDDQTNFSVFEEFNKNVNILT